MGLSGEYRTKSSCARLSSLTLLFRNLELANAPRVIVLRSIYLLLQPIAHLLPDMTLYFNLLDEPTGIVSESNLEKARRLGMEGKTWKEKEFAALETKRGRWEELCDHLKTESSIDGPSAFSSHFFSGKF